MRAFGWAADKSAGGAEAGPKAGPQAGRQDLDVGGKSCRQCGDSRPDVAGCSDGDVRLGKVHGGLLVLLVLKGGATRPVGPPDLEPKNEPCGPSLWAAGQRARGNKQAS